MSASSRHLSGPRRYLPKVMMMDGWMARYRRDDWDANPKAPTNQRVQWHKGKITVAYGIEQSVQVSKRR